MVNQRKTMVVTLNFVAGVSADAFIHVEFIPDEIIVRGVSVFSVASVDKQFLLSTNLIYDKNIAALPTENALGDSNDFFQMYFKFYNQQKISGSYNFTASNILTGATSNITAAVSIHFEFIKY